VAEPAVIAPEGDLDLHCVDALVAQFDEAAESDCPHVILDLSAVTLLDSTVLGAVIQARHRFNSQGRSLLVIAPNGSAAAVLLELTGLRSHLSVFPSRDALLA
jgi:anti-anti-sigma factor